MGIKCVLVALCLSISLHARPKPFSPKYISELYVKDFDSETPERCTTADVPLDRTQALAYFKRAKVVDHKTISDDYEIAPCRLVGTLKYKGILCEWTIDASTIGSIKTPNYEWYFICDNCEDLFKRPDWAK